MSESQQPPQGLPSWLRVAPGNATQAQPHTTVTSDDEWTAASSRAQAQVRGDEASSGGERPAAENAGTRPSAPAAATQSASPSPTANNHAYVGAQESVAPAKDTASEGTTRDGQSEASTAESSQSGGSAIVQSDGAETTHSGSAGAVAPSAPDAEAKTPGASSVVSEPAGARREPEAAAEPSASAQSLAGGGTQPFAPPASQSTSPSEAPSEDTQVIPLAPSAPGTGKHHAAGGYNLTPPPALDQSNLVNPVKVAPRRGWRKMLYSVTGGHVNVGDSMKDLEHDALLEKIRRPMRGDYRIAVMSLKGGVGKTTTTVVLGGVFATVRHDRVIAIDANPDLGTLAQRVAAPGPATIRDLLAATDVSRYAAVRQYTTQAQSRLEVIGSERDPAISEAFSEDDYRHAIDILQHHYNVILTDCGTGLMHSAMSGVLDLANTLVLVTSPALDGAQSASATLDWLNLHGYEQLAANAVVVVSAAHPGNATIDMDQLVAHFRSRTRAVHVIPFDRHLSEGAVVDLERLTKQTHRAYMELAAIVAEDFDSWHRHAQS